MRAKTRVLAYGEVVHDYRCRLESDSAGRCPAPAGASGKQGVEGYVVGRFFERIRLASRARENGAAADAEAALVRAARTLEDYVADTDLQATIGYPAYRDGLATRQGEYEDARRKLEAEQAGEVDLPDGETLAGSWDGLAVDERRRATCGSRSTACSSGAPLSAASRSPSACSSAGGARLPTSRGRDVATTSPVRSSSIAKARSGRRARRMASQPAATASLSSRSETRFTYRLSTACSSAAPRSSGSRGAAPGGSGGPAAPPRDPLGG